MNATAQSAADGRPRLQIVEIGFAEAFLARRGVRHPAPRGALFALAIHRDDTVAGVVIVGRPVPPARDDGFTVEITRTDTDGTAGVEVALYRAVWQVARLRGYRRLITHTEMGEIRRGLAAVGLRPVAALPPRAGTQVPSRLRIGRGVDGACRVLWEPTVARRVQLARGYRPIASAVPLARVITPPSHGLSVTSGPVGSADATVAVTGVAQWARWAA